MKSTNRYRKVIILSILLFLTIPTTLLSLVAPAVAQAPTQAVYLPVITKTGNSVNADSDTGAIWLPYQTQDNSVVNVRSTSLAVDPQGGIHGVYVINNGGDAGHFPAYYVYCAVQCGNAANWTRTRLGDRIAEARLQLDHAGRPRVMFFAYSADNPGDTGAFEYVYGECNGTCTQAGNWTIATLLTVQDNPNGYSDLNNRWFALDAEDHPAFLYQDLESTHNGSFYHACMANCTDAANWRDTFVNHSVNYFELAFSPAGEPRLVARDLHDAANTVKLVYYECNADCSQWQGVSLGECGPFCSYSLALDAQGRPRLVFYTGDPATLQTLEPQRLYYWWCSQACANADQADWQVNLINTSPMHGISHQLLVDGAGKPHVAYQMGDGGPGYLGCSVDCTSATPTWAAKQIEDNSILEQAFPNELNLRCTEQKWASGHRPGLALAPNGNIVVGFDVSHSYYGNDIDHPDRPCNPGSGNLLSTDIQLSRVAIFAQP